jgi:hypothetical protein
MRISEHELMGGSVLIIPGVPAKTTTFDVLQTLGPQTSSKAAAAKKCAMVSIILYNICTTLKMRRRPPGILTGQISFDLRPSCCPSFFGKRPLRAGFLSHSTMALSKLISLNIIFRAAT